MNKYDYYLIIIGIICLALLSTPAKAAYIVTNDPSAITNYAVTFSGTSNVSGIGYFEFGACTTCFLFKTDNETANGAFTETVSGTPFIAGKTYSYRAVFHYQGNKYVGATKSFTLSSNTALVDYQFGNLTDELIADDMNVTKVSQTSMKPYTNVLGDVVWGILIIVVFVAIWMRQEDITVPSLLGILISGTMITWMPLEFRNIAYILMIVSIAGLVYTYFSKR